MAGPFVTPLLKCVLSRLYQSGIYYLCYLVSFIFYRSSSRHTYSYGTYGNTNSRKMDILQKNDYILEFQCKLEQTIKLT